MHYNYPRLLSHACFVASFTLIPMPFIGFYTPTIRPYIGHPICHLPLTFLSIFSMCPDHLRTRILLLAHSSLTALSHFCLNPFVSLAPCFSNIYLYYCQLSSISTFDIRHREPHRSLQHFLTRMVTAWSIKCNRRTILHKNNGRKKITGDDVRTTHVSLIRFRGQAHMNIKGRDKTRIRHQCITRFCI